MADFLAASRRERQHLGTGKGGLPVRVLLRDLNADRDYFKDDHVRVLNALRVLYEIGSDEPGLWVLRGGHVSLADGGAFYAHWRGLVGRNWNFGSRRGPSSLTLPSSHYQGVGSPQYEVRFPSGAHLNYGALLFGLDRGGDTWFQVEAHSGTWSFNCGNAVKCRFVRDVWAHWGDYERHKASGFQNVGPAGLSGHSEKQGTEVVVAMLDCPRPGDLDANPGAFWQT